MQTIENGAEILQQLAGLLGVTDERKKKIMTHNKERDGKTCAKVIKKLRKKINKLV